MANHFRQTAQTLREVADASDTLCRLTEIQRHDLRHAADILCQVEQLKRDMVSSDFNSEAESDRLALELMALLGLQAGS